jgi:hypothetical protein
MRYEISYDLNAPEHVNDYKRLAAALKEIGAQKALFSQWIVRRTGTSAAGLRDYIWQFMDSNDRLFVVCLDSNDWGGRNLMTDPNEI